jgi:hypothetical protein
MMKRSEVKEMLVAQSIDWYLSKSDSNYFSAPELYSTLYRILYENLLAGKRPPYIPDSFDSVTISDISRCRTTFDRYLVAIFPSRYEASNPFMLQSHELNDECFLQYLFSTYAKAASDRESYNKDREVKYIFGFLSVSNEKIDLLKKNAKSQLYKLLILSYKLSIINPKWRELIRGYSRDEIHKASMDNVVDFNLLDDENARKNSALVKMFYFEIDQGKSDGDETESRRILVLPFAFDKIFNVIQSTANHLFFLNKSIEQVENGLNAIVLNLDHIIRISKMSLHYDDCNRELADLIQTTILKNVYSNGLLARELFEQNIDYQNVEITNKDNWIVDVKDLKSIPHLVEQELGLADGSFELEWLSIGETISKVVMMTNKVLPKEHHVILNLCCILVANLKKIGNVNIKSNITGKKHNDFNVAKEIMNAHEWLKEHDPMLKDKHNLSIMRPTTIHFLVYAVGQLMWAMDCGQMNDEALPCNSDYSFFRAKIFKCCLDVIDKLRPLDHASCLAVIELMCKSFYGSNYSLDPDFINGMGDDNVLGKHSERAKIVWSPLN